MAQGSKPETKRLRHANLEQADTERLLLDKENQRKADTKTARRAAKNGKRNR